MEETSDLWLYRSGPPEAPNTVYVGRTERLTFEEQSRMGRELDLVRIFSDLSSAQLTGVEQAVNQYRGSQNTLLQKISQILGI